MQKKRAGMRRLAYILALLLLSGCTRTVYQDREVVRHDTTYISKFALDTVIQRDSIRVLEKGDTFKITECKYIYKVRERVDTSYVFITDTVTNTVTKTVQKADLKSCIWTFVFGLLLSVVITVVVRRHKRQ